MWQSLIEFCAVITNDGVRKKERIRGEIQRPDMRTHGPLSCSGQVAVSCFDCETITACNCVLSVHNNVLFGQVLFSKKMSAILTTHRVVSELQFRLVL